MSLLRSIKRLFMPMKVRTGRTESEGQESHVIVDEEGWSFYNKGGDYLLYLETDSTKTVIKVKGDQVFVFQTSLGQTSGLSPKARRRVENRKQVMNWLLQNDGEPVPKASYKRGGTHVVINDQDGLSFYNKGAGFLCCVERGFTKTVIHAQRDQLNAYHRSLKPAATPQEASGANGQ